MVRPISKTVSMDVTDAEIDEMMKSLRSSVSDKKALKAIERLIFIKMRRAGIEMSKAMEVSDISKPTAYEWQEDWNKHGLESIIPNYAGGAPRRLDDEQLEAVKEELRKHDMTTEEIQAFISERFGVDYTKKQVAVRMRGLGLHFAKPYDHDYRAPDDAESTLKKTSVGRWHL